MTSSYLKALSLIDSESGHLSSLHVLEVKMACMQKLTRIYDYFYVTQESERWSSELNHLESSSHIPEVSPVPDIQYAMHDYLYFSVH